MLTISPMQNLPGFQVGPQHLLEAMTWRWGLSALLSTRDRRALRVYKASMGSRMDTHLLLNALARQAAARRVLSELWSHFPLAS